MKISLLKQKRNFKRVVSLVISILIFFVTLVIMQIDFFQMIERKTFDLRLKLRGTRPTSEEVVIIFIGDETLKHLGHPLPREHYAVIFHIMKKFGAKIVFPDVLFSEDNYDQGDQFLIEETKKSGNIFAPIYFWLSRKEYVESHLESSQAIPMPRKEDHLKVYSAESGLYRAYNVELPFEEFRNHCKGLGHVNVNRDSDGFTRRIPLFIEYEGWANPAISFAVACDFIGAKSENISVKYGDKIDISVPGAEKFSIPMNINGEIYINYSGDIGNFKNYSFLQISQAYKEYLKSGNPEFFPEIDLRDFKGKIVLIGETALGTSDVHSTAFASRYPLVGVHANVIDSIINKKFLFDAPRWINIFISLLLCMLAGLAIPRYTFQKAILFLSAIYSITLLVIFLGFFYFGIIFQLFFPSFSLGMTVLLISMFLVRYEEIAALHSQREKLSITKRLWEKEKQLHSIYDKFNDKENAIRDLQEQLKQQIDQSSQMKEEYLNKIKELKDEQDKLYSQQNEINRNKAILKSQLNELETTTDSDSLQERKPVVHRKELTGKYDFIIGESARLMEVLSVIDKAAPGMANIMITGNTGTGKELLAKAIHLNSPRKDHSFVAVNCAAIPRDLIEGELFGFEKGAFTGAVKRHIGKFEQANSGTIFLDEIGDMSLDTQAKVLRAIQEKIITRIGGKEDVKIDVRIITATHKNLKEEIEQKTFRADLFFRLNVIPAYLPSLAERKPDIPLLIDHFIRKFKSSMNITDKVKIQPQALQALMSYSWPGNIRELENVIERSLTLKAQEGEITINDLPPEINGNSPNFQLSESLYATQTLKDAVEEFERNYIVHKLNQFNWNKSKTAEEIQLGRRNLHKKITKYDISEDKDRIDEVEF